MLKRWCDILVSAFALVTLLPVIGITAALVAAKLGRPVLFRQRRPGKNGRPFEMIKFRSMTDARSADGVLLEDSLRLPRFGQLLRKTSLDELPELWNVLKGDMSLVGPRPLLMEYLPLYNDRQRRRHDVRPGITGWAQINGRNALSWQEKFELDVWYVENQSLWLDCKILIATIAQIIRPRGINQEDKQQLPDLKGIRDESSYIWGRWPRSRRR